MKTLLLLLFLLLPAATVRAEDPGFHQDPGALVPLGDHLQGRPTALALVYYRCPNLCGVILADFLTALRQSKMVAGRDYDLLVLSIDPRETPSDAADAREKHLAGFPLPGAQSAWQFLTASDVDLDRVERSVGYVPRYDKQTDQYLHPAGIVLLTPQGRVSRYLLGVGYAPEEVADGLRAAGRGDIARPSPQVRLFCFRYDPATGRYTLAVFRALQLFGGLVALSLAAVLLVAFRRERRP